MSAFDVIHLQAQVEGLIVEAIPPEGLKRIEALPAGERLNGGTSRGVADGPHRIASFNNTVVGEDEILRWLEDAKALALARGI